MCVCVFVCLCVCVCTLCYFGTNHWKRIQKWMDAKPVVRTHLHVFRSKILCDWNVSIRDYEMMFLATDVSFLSNQHTNCKFRCEMMGRSIGLLFVQIQIINESSHNKKE